MEGSFTLALAGPCAWGDTLGGLTMGGKVDMVLDLVWCTLKSLSYQKETNILIATVHMPYYYNYD